MLMVVFGAGASYDSVGVTETENLIRGGLGHLRPPLATQLFEDRPNFNAIVERLGCGDIVNYLRRAAENSAEALEDTLERLKEEAVEHELTARDLVAVRFYLQLALWECGSWGAKASGITNYGGLLSRIARYVNEGDRVHLVTFNYETMLEQSLPRYKSEPLEDLDAYVSGTYKLFKLHGSVNWARMVNAHYGQHLRKDDLRRRLIQDGSKLPVGSVFQLQEQPAALSPEDKTLLPAISAPVRGKTADSFECPEEHLAMFRSSAREVDRVLVVGWRGEERHFHELWKETVPSGVPALVVSDTAENAMGTAHLLQKSELIGQASLFPGGFSSLVGSDALEHFLAGRVPSDVTIVDPQGLPDSRSD